jgi:hyperosmotically inducible protein
MTLPRIAAIVLTSLMVGAPALAADSANYDLFRQVENQVLKYPHFTIFDSIHATVNAGVVELTGWVTMPYKRDGIAERVAKVTGVKAVRNKIEVLPVSRFDDVLRYQIARAIYSNPNFYGYGSRANPPIHVIVEHGRVTLEGVVNNNADRVIAQSIASSFGAFKITSELKTAAEAREELEKL